MVSIKRFAFGATAAVMTSMAVIEGLGSADSGRTSTVAGLLIIGIADNLSDTLGIHVHEESERHGSEAFSLAVSNYVTRLLVVGSFVLLALLLSHDAARVASLIWGIVLLSVLTYFTARARFVRPAPEIAKHLVVAAVVLALSQGIGMLLRGAV